MHAIQESIEQYLLALESVHGDAFRQRTAVKNLGDANLLIEYPDGNKSIVRLGRLRLMTDHLKHQARNKVSH